MMGYEIWGNPGTYSIGARLNPLSFIRATIMVCEYKLPITPMVWLHSAQLTTVREATLATTHFRI